MEISMSTSIITILVSFILLALPQSIFATQLTHYGHSGARYVCYEKRAIIRDSQGRNWLKYQGCYIARHSCYSNGSNHFGRYPNRYQARNALARCNTSTPRFVD
jgi:hypothetical protein